MFTAIDTNTNRTINIQPITLCLNDAVDTLLLADTQTSLKNMGFLRHDYTAISKQNIQRKD